MLCVFTLWQRVYTMIFTCKWIKGNHSCVFTDQIEGIMKQPATAGKGKWLLRCWLKGNCLRTTYSSVPVVKVHCKHCSDTKLAYVQRFLMELLAIENACGTTYCILKYKVSDQSHTATYEGTVVSQSMGSVYWKWLRHIYLQLHLFAQNDRSVNNKPQRTHVAAYEN